jgi:hypothetical protein
MSNPAHALPDDPGALRAMLVAERHENERLRQIIKPATVEIRRTRFIVRPTLGGAIDLELPVGGLAHG